MASDGQAEYRQLRDIIYTFMYYSNKPMTGTEMALQFKNQKKSMVEKILEDLVAKEKITMRLFAKTRVYCLSQNMEFKIDDAYTDEIDSQQDQTIEDKCLRYLKWNYERHAGELSRLREEGSELDAKVAVHENELSIEELERAICGMEDTIKRETSTHEETISYDEFGRMRKMHAALKKKQNKLATTLKDIADRVSEGMGISRREFLEQTGVDEI